MKLNEVTANQSSKILNESWETLTEAQQLHVSRWESRVWPLVEQYSKLLEQELTPDQIQKIFTSAEQVAKATGNNQTALGKAGKVTSEVTGKMKDEIEKLAKQAQNSGPIKNMDQQFDKLRTQLSSKLKGNPAGQKILQGVDKWKTFADENPAKSAFVIGAMTSILAFASGGIVSGAAIGFFIKLANNTIKGDKLSTAVGKSVKGAAIGAVAGAIGDVVGDNINVDPPAEKGGAAEIKVSVSSEEVADAAGSEEGTDTSELFSEMTEDEYRLNYAERIASTIKYSGGMEDAMIQKIADNLTIEGTYPNDFKINFEGTVVRGNIYLTPEELAQWQRFIKPDDPFAPNGTMGKETTQWLKDNVEGVEEQFAAEEAERAARLEKAKANYDAMSAEEQKAYDDKQRQKYGDFLGDPDEYTPPGEPKYTQESIEEQLWSSLGAYELREAPAIAAALGGAARGIGKAASKTADVVGKAAAKGVAKAGSAAKSAGNELGNKVTAKKLMRMWNKSGKPTDMGSVVNLLNQAGISDEQIGTVGKQARIPLEKPKSANAVKDKGTTKVDPKLQALANEIKKLGLEKILKPKLADG